MKVAFYSPFPPKRTGIAAYSRALVDAMRAGDEVTAIDHDNPDLTASDPDACDIARHPEALAQPDRWDAHVFSLGNNPHYHLAILDAFQRTGGTLLLHDTVLYFLYAGLSRGAFLKAFCQSFGGARSGEIPAIAAASPDGNILRYPHPERYPFLAFTVGRADTIVVHSEFAARTVRAAAPDARVELIPHLALVPEMSAARTALASELRASVAPRPGAVVLGSFGFLGPTKRFPALAEALGRLRKKLDFHLVIVGDGPDPLPVFREAGLADRVTWLPYVSDDDFNAWIESADIVINLRHPSMGESSGTLTRAMGMGKPCLVSDHGTFSELPDTTVWKVSTGEAEMAELATAIRTLGGDARRRGALGARAADHVRERQSPAAAARQLGGILRRQITGRAQLAIADIRSDSQSSADIRATIDRAISNALPPHLHVPESAVGSPCPAPIALGLTRESVVWAYRTLLLRDPGSEAEITAAMENCRTIHNLRGMILHSEEFKKSNSRI